MNIFEIRDILNAHKEHFRVLPTLAENELNGIISTINEEENALLKETKRVVGKRTSKATKNPKRSKR